VEHIVVVAVVSIIISDNNDGNVRKVKSAWHWRRRYTTLKYLGDRKASARRRGPAEATQGKKLHLLAA
jgi:hypothetical protein